MVARTRHGGTRRGAVNMPGGRPGVTRKRVLWLTLLAACAVAADPAPNLKPGATFTVTFPDMPATYYAIAQHKDVKAQMTVFLPTNYDTQRKHPLFIFLNGGDGGPGGNPGVARALCEDKDFVCVNMPLFKAAEPKAAGDNIMRDPDAKYMWPRSEE